MFPQRPVQRLPYVLSLVQTYPLKVTLHNRVTLAYIGYPV